MADSRSSMVPYGFQWNGCGYCGSRAAREDTSANYYAGSKQMQPRHYQGLVDRGWRRSGTTYYKPDLRNGCCPHYTIRLDATSFKATRNQRQVLNAWNKHVIGIEYKSKAARLAPESREQKTFRRHNWDLCHEVRRAEYPALARPVDPKSKAPIGPAHRLEISLESDAFTEEKYALFENYQRTVHRDPPSKISRSGFRSFLCSGLGQAEDHKGKKLGSYHHCYRLDGKLVALGVLDLLPDVVSSVYLLYDESVSHWQLGKISALQEIALAREGGYSYYYMGYYIHSCQKMRYKADYRPTYVINPVDYTWHPLDQSFRSSLMQSKFAAFVNGAWTPQDTGSEDSGEQPDDVWVAGTPGVLTPEEVAEMVPLKDVPVMIGKELYSLDMIVPGWNVDEIKSGRTLQSAVAEWVACVGPALCREVAIQFNS